MADAKDILGILKTGFSVVQEKKPRAPKGNRLASPSVDEMGIDGAVEKVDGEVDSISPSPIPALLHMLRVYL